MKRIIFALLLAVYSFYSLGQKQVTIKAGTIVPLQSITEVKAADVDEGQTIDFRVSQDVIVDGICAIPVGTIAKGKVMEARKSTVAGTKGKLWITISNLFLPSGEAVYFTSTEVRISGKNRTPLSVVTAIFMWPCIFIPGTKAVMPAGYDVQATVVANTPVTVN